VKRLVVGLALSACSSSQPPRSQLGRLTPAALVTWAAACDGHLAPQAVCLVPAKDDDFARVPWTPDCQSYGRQERLHCDAERSWDLWTDDQRDWVMAICVHGKDEPAVLRSAHAVITSVFSVGKADRLTGLALAPIDELSHNLIWWDVDRTVTNLRDVTRCWEWIDP
jgi:hypothetical protein